MPQVYVCIRTSSNYSDRMRTPPTFDIFAVCDSVEAAEHACREKARDEPSDETGGEYEDDVAPYEWEGPWNEWTRIKYEEHTLSSDTGPSSSSDDDSDADGGDEALPEGGAKKRPRET